MILKKYMLLFKCLIFLSNLLSCEQFQIELEWMETKMSMNDLENLFKIIG